jgi:DNA-binding CsgD family transcriptional regulator
MSESRPLNQDLLARHIAIRAIYQDACRNDQETLEYATWMTSRGASLRTVPVVPLQLVLVDRTVAIVPISAAEPRVGALEVRNLSIVTVVSALFEQVWQNATPLGEQPPRRRNGLRPQEHQILVLLAGGGTDEMIARRMGVSVRTVRRTVADLTERLNASSRFQAGLQASRAGWL